MTCAMKVYSQLKIGKVKQLPDQYASMDKFYHGKEPTHPAQIKLFAEAHIRYQGLYEEVNVTVKKKSTKSTSTIQ